VVEFIESEWLISCHSVVNLPPQLYTGFRRKGERQDVAAASSCIWARPEFNLEFGGGRAEFRRGPRGDDARLGALYVALLVGGEQASLSLEGYVCSLMTSVVDWVMLLNDVMVMKW